MQVDFIGGLLIILINSTFMGMLFSLFSYIQSKKTAVSGIFILVLLWISYEYFLIHGKPGWPWLLLGNGLGSSVSMVQWYDRTGVLGGSLWVLIINILLFRFLSSGIRNQTLLQFLFSFLLFLFILLGPWIGSWMLHAKDYTTEKRAKVLIVQSNTDPYTEKFISNRNHQEFEKLLEMTMSEEISHYDLVLWPETTLDSLWLREENDSRIEKLNSLLEEAPGTSFLFGAMSFTDAPDLKKASIPARQEGGKEFVVSNSIIQLSKGGVSEYKKNILVPGVETQPVFFHDLFRMPYQPSLGGVSGGLYTDASKTVFYLADSFAIVPVICFESAHGEHVASFRSETPFIIAVFTNDGWFKGSGYAYRQHLLMSRLRAIENRTELVRSANTGISAHILPNGEIAAFLETGREGSLSVEVSPTDHLTYYAIHGDYMGRIFVFFLVVAMLAFLVRALIYGKSAHRLPY